MPQFTIDPLVTPGRMDCMVAAGVQSAGVCKLLSGGERSYNWDVQQAPGLQGYRMTYRGWKAGDPIVMRFEFFEHFDGPGYGTTESQIESFYQLWVPLFAIDARKMRPNPVTVQYPPLASNDITRLVCKSIGPMTTDGSMRWWVDMTFLEWRPPIIVPVATPKGATDRLGVPTPQNKVQVEIAKEKVLADRPI